MRPTNHTHNLRDKRSLTKRSLTVRQAESMSNITLGQFLLYRGRLRGPSILRGSIVPLARLFVGYGSVAKGLHANFLFEQKLKTVLPSPNYQDKGCPRCIPQIISMTCSRAKACGTDCIHSTPKKHYPHGWTEWLCCCKHPLPATGANALVL